jgi:hypothetical protein
MFPSIQDDGEYITAYITGITAMLDTRPPFPYHECPSEVEDADPERMGKNL